MYADTPAFHAAYEYARRRHASSHIDDIISLSVEMPPAGGQRYTPAARWADDVGLPFSSDYAVIEVRDDMPLLLVTLLKPIITTHWWATLTDIHEIERRIAS